MTAFFMLGFVLLFGAAVLCALFLVWWVLAELYDLVRRLFGGES